MQEIALYSITWAAFTYLDDKVVGQLQLQWASSYPESSTNSQLTQTVMPAVTSNSTNHILYPF